MRHSPAPCSRRAAAGTRRRYRPPAVARGTVERQLLGDDAGEYLIAAHRIRRRRRPRRACTGGCCMQHALDLDRGDVLAAAADDVLLAVDEVQLAVGVAPHDVAGVEPAALPGCRRGLGVLQVFAEEAVARLGAGMPHQQFARLIDRRPRRRRPQRCAPRARRPGLPKQLVPDMPRLARLATTTAPAPVSVIAQASISGKPKRASKVACMPRGRHRRRSRSAPDARGHPGCRRAPISIAGMTPR